MEKDGENKFKAEKELVKGSWLHLFVPHEIQKLQNVQCPSPSELW